MEITWNNISEHIGGPGNANWSKEFSFDEAIPIENVSWFRLRTTIILKDKGSNTNGSGQSPTGIDYVPNIKVYDNKYKIGAQLNILWNTEI